MIPDHLPTWSGFAGVAVLAACWRQLLAVLNRLRSFAVVQTEIEGPAAQAVSNYCWQHFRRSPMGDRLYRSTSAHVRPLGRVQDVAFEKPPLQPLIFFEGWKPLLMGGVSENPNAPTACDWKVKLTTVRWLWDVEKLILAALDEQNASNGCAVDGGSRYRVHHVTNSRRRDRGADGVRAVEPMGFGGSNISQPQRFLRWSQQEIGAALPAEPMKALSLPAEVQPAVEEFTRWLESEAWFKARGVPWRRGMGLYGPPGTGKTSLVRALAQLGRMPVWCFDVASLSNAEMMDAWQQMQETVPCIALIEDIDGAFHGRTNVVATANDGQRPLTFDCLLQCLGGIESADGVFVVVTTNHIDKVDPALGVPSNGDVMSTRPGRLDRWFLLPPLPASNREEIARRIVGEWPELVCEAMAGSDGFTGAQMTERCVQMALARFWGQEKQAHGLAENAPQT
jgi:ATPase family associated with various cellular activities (AAA)